MNIGLKTILPPGVTLPTAIPTSVSNTVAVHDTAAAADNLTAEEPEGSAIFTYDNITADINGTTIRLRDILTPTHDIPSRERTELYRLIPEHLRTAHTSRLLRIAEIREFFNELTAANLHRNLGRVKAAAHELKRLTGSIIEMYTEKGLRPLNGILRLVNEAYNGRNATAVRIDFDIGILNKRDQTGSLADEYIPAIGNWLLSKIEYSDEAVRIFGDFLPVVIRLLERTSFIIVGSNSEQGRKLVEFVKRKLTTFEDDIRGILLAQQKEGHIAQSVDLSSFRPTATVYHSTLYFTSFMERQRRVMHISNIKQVPRHMVISLIEKELTRFNAEAVWLKDHSPAKMLTIGGFRIYNNSALPKKNANEGIINSLKTYIARRKGTIPFGVFGFEDETDPEVRSYNRFPDIRHAVGEITRPRRIKGGGSLEYFLDRVYQLTQNNNKQRDGELLNNIKRAAEDLCQRLLNMGEEARHDPQYLALMKPTRRTDGENANFFMEQIALLEAFLRLAGHGHVKYNIIATIEFDDAKASLDAIPPSGATDARFQGYRKLLLTTAESLGLYPVIVAAEGDQLRAAFAGVNMAGAAIDPALPLSRYQLDLRRIGELKNEFFQPTVKFERGEQLLRLPVWFDPTTGNMMATRARPKGAVPWKKVVGATISYAYVDLSTPDGVVDADKKIRCMFKYIDKKLKFQHGPFIKQGFGRLPEDFTGEE